MTGIAIIVEGFPENYVLVYPTMFGWNASSLLNIPFQIYLAVSSRKLFSLPYV